MNHTPAAHARLAALLLIPAFTACGGGAMDTAPMPERGPADALATITAEDVAREVGVLAHDSMRGRDTPSPELEQAAAYLADRFRSFGLEPAGDDGTFIHRWAWEVTRLTADSTGISVDGAADPGPRYGTDFFLVPGAQPTTAEAVYVGVAGEDRPAAEHGGRIVLIDHPGTAMDQQWQQTLMMGAIQPAMMTGAAALVVILSPDMTDAPIEQLAQATSGQQAPIPVVGITSAGAARLIEATGHDLAALREAGGATALGAPVSIRWSRATEDHAPPNVAAMRRGSDPSLRDTYVVVTAHFDHVGVGSPDETGDSIYNGADDDASGTSAIVEMAEAFASLPEAPARSVIFLAVSGEEKGLLGSMAYAEDPPVISIGSVVANVNMDMVGRNAPDTIVGIGQEYSTLEGVLSEIQASHPELGLNVVLDQWPDENLFFRSDQLAFIQQGIPAVFFTTGLHDDYHRPSDEPAVLDNDKVARVARLAFLLAYHIAQDPVAPAWTEEGRRAVEQMLQQSPF